MRQNMNVFVIDPLACPSQRGETALHLAAEAGNEELCRLLLDHGASLETKEQASSLVYILMGMRELTSC